MNNSRKEKIDSSLQTFFARFGTFKPLNCYKCYKQADKTGIDFDPNENLFTIFCECHGDREEVQIPYASIYKFNKLTFKPAFQLNASTRLNGKLVKRLE